LDIEVGKLVGQKSSAGIGLERQAVVLDGLVQVVALATVSASEFGIEVAERKMVIGGGAVRGLHRGSGLAGSSGACREHGQAQCGGNSRP
jgi:hypothetical protein